MKRASHYVSFLSLAGGLGLLAYVLHRAGVNTVVAAMRLMGSAFLTILVLSGLRHFLRTVAWRSSLDPGVPSPGFLNLLTIRLIAESATDLSPAGPLLGETIRAWAAAKTISSTVGVTSVLIEDLAYGLGTALFVLLGAFTIFASAIRRTPVNVAVIAALLIVAALILFLILQQRQACQELAVRMRHNKYAQKFFDRHGRTIGDWVTGVRSFLQRRKKLLLAILLIEIAVNVISLAETALIVTMTTAHASLMTAYLIESANRGVQLISGFVPFGLGVDEATTAATLRSLGHSLQDGVSVAVVRKIRSIFWDLIGLGLAAHFAYTRRSQGDVCSARKEAVGLAQGLELATQRRIS
jgi:Lysylphosphatidylglycerol synthase TM region